MIFVCVCMKEPGECFDLIPLQPFQLVSVHLWPLITAASVIHHCMYTRFSHYHRLPSFSSRWKLPVCLSPWATALARELCCVYSYIACIMEGGNLNEGTVRVSCCPPAWQGDNRIIGQLDHGEVHPAQQCCGSSDSKSWNSKLDPCIWETCQAPCTLIKAYFLQVI